MATVTNIISYKTLPDNINVEFVDGEVSIRTHRTQPEFDEPKIIKVAKLALILADNDIELKDKLCSIQVAIRMGYITKEEGVQLLAYRPELEELMRDVEGS